MVKRTKRSTWLGIGVALTLWLGGCGARRPVLYPNAKLQSVGRAAAERDVDACMRLAQEYLSSGGRIGTTARNVATDTAIGGAGGAAVGAVGGAVLGDAGRGAAVGAATGATAGLMNSIFGSMRSREPDPAYANFVARCLSERGYETIGWE